MDTLSTVGEGKLKKISDLFGEYKRPEKKRKRTERGDLLEYFCQVINATRDETKYKPITVKSMGFLLGHIKDIRDLYYMKSYMEDLRREGKNASSWFWWSIKAK